MGSWSRNHPLGGGSGGSATRVAVSAAVRYGVGQEPPERTPRPPCFVGHAPRYAAHGRAPGRRVFGPGDRNQAAGRREPNPRGVSGRNTPPGPRRSKPPGSWETAKADRSGIGTPRRGAAVQRSASRAGTTGADRRREPPADPGGMRRTGKWIPRAGSAEGERILREELRSERAVVVGRAGAKGRDANEVLEGACKVKGGIPTLLATAEPATRRKTPRSRSRDQGRRWSRQAEPTATPGRQTPKISTTPRRARSRATREATAGDRTVATPQRTGESNPENERPATASRDTPQGEPGTQRNWGGASAFTPFSISKGRHQGRDHQPASASPIPPDPPPSPASGRPGSLPISLIAPIAMDRLPCPFGAVIL